jgi:hypothetical protein
LQWPHRESNPRASGPTDYTMACPLIDMTPCGLVKVSGIVEETDCFCIQFWEISHSSKHLSRSSAFETSTTTGLHSVTPQKSSSVRTSNPWELLLIYNLNQSANKCDYFNLRELTKRVHAHWTVVCGEPKKSAHQLVTAVVVPQDMDVNVCSRVVQSHGTAWRKSVDLMEIRRKFASRIFNKKRTY